MTPTPSFRPPPRTEVPAIVRAVNARDVLWNRPVFKAPPLRVEPPVRHIRDFAEATGAAPYSPRR